MRKIILGTLLVASTVTAAKATGGGNGGDVIECYDSKSETWGYRTLDSVVMESQPFFTKVENRHTVEALDQIIQKFEETLPIMGAKLSEFRETFNKKSNSNHSVFWIDSKLYDVQDENLYIRLPEGCDDEIVQAVNLVKKPFKRFYYDSEVLKLIEHEGDELSWLLVHEWLRDFVDDSDVIRIINAYLHSQEFLAAKDIEIYNTLGTLGITSGRGIAMFTIKGKIREQREKVGSYEDIADNLESILSNVKNRPSYKETTEFEYQIGQLGVARAIFAFLSTYTSEFDEFAKRIDNIEKTWNAKKKNF